MMTGLLRAAIVAAGAAAAFNSAVLGDIIQLKNGNALEGKIIEETDDSVVLDMPAGKVTVSRDDIAGIERKISPLEIYEEEAARLDDDDSVGHYVLGMWCKKKGLTRQAEAEFLKTIAANPDHAEARKELGHVMHAGKWMPRDEAMKAKGFVKVDGEWMTRKDAEAVALEKRQEEWLRKLRRAASLMCGPKPALGRRVFEEVSLGDDSAEVVPALRVVATHKCSLAREEAINALARLRTPDAFDAIVEAVLNESDDEIFEIAVARLQELNSKRAAKVLMNVCKDLRKSLSGASNDRKPAIVAAIRRASKAMGIIGEELAVPELARCVVLKVNYLQEVDDATNVTGMTRSSTTSVGPIRIRNGSASIELARSSGVSISTKSKGLKLVPNYYNREAADALARITGRRYDFDSKRWLQWWALHKPIFPPAPELFELN